MPEPTLSEPISEPITAAISDRICQHMNEDHGDALILYAQVYGNQSEVESATLDAIDPSGMDLTVHQHDQSLPLRIRFDHELKDAEDAHQTLIAMVKQARQQKKS
jgi:putative heme iron utilization protein